MATINLLPISDVSGNHSCNTGSTKYTLIDDPVDNPDDNSTYIYCAATSEGDTATANATSVFKFSNSGTYPYTNTKVYITGITAITRAAMSTTSNSASGNIRDTISINGGSGVQGSAKTVNSTTYSNKTTTFSNVSGYNQTYASFSSANIQLSHYSYVTTSSGKSGSQTAQTRTTQIYLTVTYLPYFNFAVGGQTGCTACVNVSEAKEGDNVRFTAIPNSGYRFIGWYSDSSYTTLVSTNTSYQVDASADTTLYAKALRVCTVTVHGSDHFTASVSPSSGIAGDVCVATATHSTGIASFDGWFSDAACTQRVYSYSTYEITLESSDIELWVGSTLRFGLYHKINGQWVLMNKVYRKENGVWVIKENPDQIMSTDVKNIDRTQQ